MYPIPENEHLVENRVCKQCSIVFPITDRDMEFYAKMSPIFPSGGVPTTGGGVVAPKKYLIPPPTLCPDCRQQRRLAFRNERKLYKRKCDATGKEMVSMFTPGTSYIVYSPEEWYKYDFLIRDGESISFDQSFFDQFAKLMRKIPQIGLSVAANENCDYTNQCGNSKDCYYSFDVGMAENCFYSNFIDDSTFLVDCGSTHESHYCYDCTDALRCSSCISLLRCEDCSFSSRLIDCSGCQYCFECVNLRNAKYCHRNIQYSKEDWENIMKNNQKGQISWEEFILLYPRKNLNMVATTESIGDTISYSKNAIYSFETKDSENVKYIDRSRILKNSMDIRGFGNNLERAYDSLAVGLNAHEILFCMHCWGDIARLQYCMYCIHGTTDCFGCIGLQNKQYCILNTQYTKEEYEILVPRIIEKMLSDGEWGEFFPASMSPFGYNETVAAEYYPLSREVVLGETSFGKEVPRYEAEDFQKGNRENPQSLRDSSFQKGALFNWSDYEAPFPTVEKIIPASKLPDSIENIPDDILNWAIECEVSGKPFRIIRQELEFYRKHNLPIPRRHPDVRHMDRMKMRNPRKLFERICDCERCEENWKEKGIILDDTNSLWKDPETIHETSSVHGSGGRRKKMITTYAPERPETVYCEVCYEREVLA